MKLSRRHFLAAGIAGAATACTGSDTPLSQPGSTEPTTTTDAPTTTTEVQPTLAQAPDFAGPDPFGLGVASGDPDSTSVVLWTRLVVPDNQIERPESVAVDVALDDTFETLVTSVIADAPAIHGHSVHAIVENLEPDTWYQYRFRVGDTVSPTGSTRTMPSAGNAPPLRFGFSSCQNWEQGTYAAHRELVDSDLDLFVWLGDYIYESGPNNQGTSTSAGPRLHESPEVTDLAGYRGRYIQYRSDPWLQAHHAARPWIVTWDDHEVDNNYAGLANQDDQDAASFEQRRQAAQQAWWEHMPVRIAPPDPDSSEPFLIHRTARWGDLLDLHMLDGRQFRDPQPTDGETINIPQAANLGIRTLGPTARSTDQTFLGIEQRQWLIDQVESSTATWSVLGNQVYMHGLNALPGAEPSTNTDSWDGYFGERRLLLETLGATATNLVVLTGDFHAGTVADLRPDPYDLSAPVVGTEFMAPAISSRFPAALLGLAPLVIGLNPQVRHFEPANGFMVCEVDESTWSTRIFVVDAADENSPSTAAGDFTVAAGTPGVDTVALPS